jgi:hypothetical protein
LSCAKINGQIFEIIEIKGHLKQIYDKKCSSCWLNGWPASFYFSNGCNSPIIDTVIVVNGGT